MQRTAVLILLSLCSLAASAADGRKATTRPFDLGVVPIGPAPADLRRFTASDCAPVTAIEAFDHCGAMDAQGRRYVFVGQRLASVMADQDWTAKGFVLPGGLRFGVPIEMAAAALADATGVAPLCEPDFAGDVVCSSQFDVKSSNAEATTVELVADAHGTFFRIEQRVRAID